jgi:hypothetical protein
MNEREAMKLALEFADDVFRGNYKGNADEVITAIREALADHIGDANKMVEQPEQEPVAEDVSIQGHFEADITVYYKSTNLDWDSAQEAYKDKWTQAAFCGWQSRQLIHTTPPHRKPLTDEEIDAIYTGVLAVHHEIDSYVFARAIEAKLKEG